jgi:hypothetical protein
MRCRAENFFCAVPHWYEQTSRSHGRHERIKFGKYIFAMFMIIFNAPMLSHHHNYRLSLFSISCSLFFLPLVCEKKQIVERRTMTWHKTEKFYLSSAMHKPVRFV